ncbi:hypothetical protein GCM10027034_11740 [Ramlibacter solisilvae]|uniref:Uncharacterized protein n=1 Tax=Ramlibacter tataouinensis TaxID=94132 RepID=A0A127JX16_9BURK|nr:hypothetical protein [Ramlibacter tataouinensis]AMO24540.1 hypothetical protein UC35_18960 [Ramlibacter tataouinensis]
MNQPSQRIVLAALVLAALPATAQVRKDDIKVAQADDARCRKEVKDYLETLRFVRTSAGSAIGSRVAGSFVSEGELDRVVQSQGYCVGAQLLRTKGTPR